MNRKLKNLILAVLLCAAAFPVFALEEYVSMVYKEIDVAFANRSDENLDKILQKYQGDDYYFLMENYSMKKVRRLIIINDYEFAMNVALVIIDNNLDNIEAVELYATITDAYEMQKTLDRLAEEKRQAEEIRLVNLKEEQRGTAAKQYNAVTTSTGDTVYVTGKDGGQLTYNGLNYSLGVVPGFVMNSSVNEENNLKAAAAGIALDFGYYTIFKKTNIGGDLGIQAGIPLSGQDQSIFVDASLAGKIAFREFMDKFFLRAGVAIEGSLKGESNTALFNQDIQNAFVTPLLGFKFQEIPVGKMAVSAGVDWLAAHLWTPGLKAAGKVDFSMNIPFGVTDKVILDFIIGARDIVFLKNTGLENRTNFVIALGGRNVK